MKQEIESSVQTKEEKRKAQIAVDCNKRTVLPKWWSKSTMQVGKMCCATCEVIILLTHVVGVCVYSSFWRIMRLS